MRCGCLPRLFRKPAVESCPLLVTVDSALAGAETKFRPIPEVHTTSSSTEDKESEHETSPTSVDSVKEESESSRSESTTLDNEEAGKNSITIPTDSRRPISPGRQRRNGQFFRNLFKSVNNSTWESDVMEKCVICELQVDEANSRVLLQLIVPSEAKNSTVLKLSPSLPSLFRLRSRTNKNRTGETEDSDLGPPTHQASIASSSDEEDPSGLEPVRGKERSVIPCFTWTVPVSADDEDEEVRFSDKTGMAEAPPGLVGLANLGNTCFLNAALQCLRCTPGFTTLVVPELRDGFKQVSNSGQDSSMIVEDANEEVNVASLNSTETSDAEDDTDVVSPRPTSRSHSFGTLQGVIRCHLECDFSHLTRVNSLPAPLPLEVGGILTGSSGLAGGSISRLSSVPNLSLMHSLSDTGQDKTESTKEEEEDEEGELSVDFITAFRKLMQELCLGECYSWWSAQDLYQQMKKLPQGEWLCDGGQHDCQEILKVLLDTIHAEYNQGSIEGSIRNHRSLSDVPVEDREALSALEIEQLKAESMWKQYLSTESSPITDVFAGQLQIVRTCQKCHCRNTTYEPFWDLSLSLTREKSGWFNAGRMPSSLYDLLRAFTAAEVLQGDDAPFCEECNQKSPATRRILIHRFPSVLVLNIKRFKYTREGREKLTCGIGFAINGLRLQNFASKEYQQKGKAAVYDLYAVSNHYGNLGGGHYTACCKVKDSTNKEGWFCFNDKRVFRVTEDSVSTPNAYILFYAKRQSSTN